MRPHVAVHDSRVRTLSNALRQRRIRSILRRARRWYGSDVEDLASVATLDDATRHSVRRAVLAYNVRVVAGTPVLTAALFWTAVAIGGLVNAVGPFLLACILNGSQLTPVRVLLGAAVYSSVGTAALGVLVSWGAAGAMRRILAPVCRSLCAVSLLMTMSVVVYLAAGDRYGDLIPGMLLGAVSAAIGLLVAFVLQSVGGFVISWGTTFTCRLCGSMAASSLVTVKVFYLLIDVDRFQGSCLQTDARKRLLWRISRCAGFVRDQIPRLQWLIGGSARVRGEARRRCESTAEVLSGFQWQVAETRTRQGFADLRNDIAVLLTMAAAGAWTEPTDATTVVRPSRIRRLARRCVAPVALAATAFVLPYVPGVSADDAAIRAIQIGLVTASLLTLASVDGSAQDRVLGALGSAGRHSP